MKIKCSHCGREVKVGKKTCPHCKSEIKYKLPPRRQLPWFLILLATTVLCGLLIVAAWFAFGNILLLNIHGKAVTDKINSGNLDFTYEDNEAYSQLPEYVKGMLDTPDDETDGPIITAMLPYIRAEVESVDGLFGAASVNYRIYAPDLESWVLNLDTSTISSADELFYMLEAYIKTAPLREETVSVSCYKDGLFAMKGIYDDPAFLNALYGGFNSAYQKLYRDMMTEIKEASAQ